MLKSQAIGLLAHYRSLIDAMQGGTYYREDDDGVLRRWYPPRRPITDKETSE